MTPRDNEENDKVAKPFLTATRPILVTGGAGFIGCNLADRLASEGHHVLIFDALARPGVERNLAWLKKRHPSKIATLIADIRDTEAIAEAASRAQAVFHYAAQVAVTTSLTDPVADFDINARGTLLLLDRLRRRPDPPPLVFASTNKVYGDLADIDLVIENGAYVPRDPELRRYGVSETRPLDFHTPYGCSKGAADQYVLDWAHSFGVPTVVLRMSCIYGPRQFGTEDQGWVAHFVRRVLAGEPITIYGDGRQVRDVLQVNDAVNAYIAAWKRVGTARGQAFNLGGGPRNAVSLLEIIAELEQIVGVRIALRREAWRSGDQRYFVADTRRAFDVLNLPAAYPWRRGLAELVDWFQREGSAAKIGERAGMIEAALPAELAS